MASVSMPPNTPRPPPRRAFRGPDPGTINITRRRSTDKLTNDWVIRAGPIHLRRRHIDIEAAPYPICQICGHPYDHNGKPHTAAHTSTTKRGEAITGPDGNVYNWTGQVWIKRP